MKKTKKILSVLLALLMIISIIPMSSITASAATFEDINQPNVFLKQPKGSVTCTLVAATMMVRRAAMMNGNSNWASITESSMKSTAWTDSGGLWYSFTYAGISVKHANLTGGSSNTATLINLLNQHPEGIVLYKSSYPSHAILLTDYTNGIFYCADPGYGTPTGRIPISSAVYVTIANATEYWYVSSPKCTLTTNVPTPDINYATNLAGNYYLQNKGSGDWLSVSENKNASTQPINTWGTWYKEFRVNLVATGNGYKINFPVISSLLMNPYSDSPTVGTKVNLYQDVNDITQWWGFEKVGDAYAIRCMYNPSLVLTDNGVMPATLTTYTGASNQLWYLHPHSTTVSYNANGGSGAPGSQTKYFNENLTLSSTKPTRSGYTFAGWGTSSGDTSVDYYAGGTYTQNSSITLYAIWTPNTYTVSYNANGGSGAPGSQTKYHNQSLTLSSTKPTRSGYTFLGWSTSSTATSATYQPGANFTSNANTTLYAVWKATSTTLTANSSNDAVISSGGEMKYYTFTPSTSGKYVIYSTSSADTKVYLYNSAGTELTYDDDSGENRNFRLEYEMTAGITYRFGIMYYGSSTTGTIPFKFGQVYTVSYHANGGTGIPSSQNKDYGATLTLSSYVPTRSGYTFLGWATSSTATSATYQPGASFTSNANTTLYAVWQKDVVEPKVHISNNNIILTLGWTESTYIYAWATDTTSSYTVQYQIADANIVGCSWGEWTSDNKCPLTITAKSKGTTTVTVSLIDYETKEVLDSVDLTVTIGVHSSYVDFSIKEPSTTTIRYKDGIVLHIDGYIPEGARVEWAVDSNAFDGATYDDGMSCLLVSKNNGYTTVVATLYDVNNNIIATDSVELRSKAGFFDKIGGFFRSLFGATTIYDA